jgi:chromosome segregation ATPase
MAVDTNFERLEQEVARLVEMLGRMRQDNADQRRQIEDLTAANQDLTSRLTQTQIELEDMIQAREVVRGRVATLLTKLESVEN